MAHEAGARTAAHTAFGSHEHHGPAPEHSHQPTDHRAPIDHCPNASSCASVLVVADATVESIDSPHSGRVVQLAALEPPSESPDLEPPPPKA